MKTIQQLYDERLSDRQIAKYLGTTHYYVAIWRKEHNLVSNWYKRNAIEKITDRGITVKECNICHIEKPITEFQVGRKNKPDEYRFGFCNDCRRKEINRKVNLSLDRNLKDRYSKLRHRSKKRNIPFSIEWEEFREQYYNQRGLCFYTDDKMTFQYGKGSSDDTLSVDKIIPEKGYISGNVVFCKFKINSIKRDLSLQEIEKYMPDFYKRIMNYLSDQGGYEF